ncbi:MAG: DUF3108 domain-containing protein [Alphaproteobacteria bacterium]
MMKLHPRKTLSALALSLALGFSAMPWAMAAAMAAESALVKGETLSLGYDIYVGGLHALAATVDVTQDGPRYRATAAGQTKGLINFLFAWTSRVKVTGQRHEDGYRPQRYLSASRWRGKARARRLDFFGGGAYRLERMPPRKTASKRQPLPPEMIRHTVDPLTAGLKAIEHLVRAGSCGGTIRVFDGKRRYDIALADEGGDVVEPSRLSIFQGPARRCRFTMDRIHGFKKRRYTNFWNDSEDNGQGMWDFEVWIARPKPGVPPVPVRFEGEIHHGSVMIHLTHAAVKPSGIDAAILANPR